MSFVLKLNSKSSFRAVLFLFLMGFVFSKLNINVFIDSMKNVNKKFLILAIMYFFIYPWFGIERWRRLVLKNYSLKYNIASKIYFLGEGINLILPSKIGDLSKSYFLKKYKICPTPFANGTVVYEKLLDLLSILIIFLVSWILNEQVLYVSRWLVMLLVLVFLIGIFAMFNLHFLEKKFSKAFPYKYNFITKPLFDFFNYFKMIKTDYVSIIFLLGFSLFFWVGHFFQVYLFIRASNIDIGFFQVTYFMPLIIILSLLPFTIAGFGPRELSLLFFLSEVSTNENIILSSLLISLRYLIPGTVGLFVYLFFEKNKDIEIIKPIKKR